MSSVEETHHWDEGRSGAGVPVAIFSGMALFASLPLKLPSLAALAVMGVVLGATAGSGFTWDGPRQRHRSYVAWGRVRWGRWRVSPADGQWQIRHTKVSTMNRRGAPNAVGTESWALGWRREGGDWTSVHEFTHRPLAQDVAQTLGIPMQ